MAFKDKSTIPKATFIEIGVYSTKFTERFEKSKVKLSVWLVKGS